MLDSIQTKVHPLKASDKVIVTFSLIFCLLTDFLSFSTNLSNELGHIFGQIRHAVSKRREGEARREGKTVTRGYQSLLGAETTPVSQQILLKQTGLPRGAVETQN